MSCKHILASKSNQSKIVSLYTIGLLLDLTLNEISVFTKQNYLFIRKNNRTIFSRNAIIKPKYAPTDISRQDYNLYFLNSETFGKTAYYLVCSFSSNILMKYPPTTERAWKPRCFGLSVKTQSDIGMRSTVSFIKL